MSTDEKQIKHLLALCEGSLGSLACIRDYCSNPNTPTDPLLESEASDAINTCNRIFLGLKKTEERVIKINTEKEREWQRSEANKIRPFFKKGEYNDNQ